MNTQCEETSYGLPYGEFLFDSLPLGIVFQDAQGKITAANPAAQKILGLTVDQMRGITSVDPRWRAIHEDGSPFPGETHPAMVCLRTGRPVRDVVMGVFNPKLEALTWINITAIPILDSANETALEAYALFQDITAEKQAELQKQESEKQYSALFSAMSEGLVLHQLVFDASGQAVDYRILDVNPAFELQTSIRRDDVIGKLASEAYGTKDAPYLEMYARVARTGIPTSFESYFAPLDRHFRITVFSPRAEQFATVFLDITDQVRTNQALAVTNKELAEREAMLRQIYDTSRAAIFVVDLGGHIYQANQHMSEMFRLPLEKLVETDYFELVHPLERDIARQKLCALGTGEIPLIDYERLYLRTDGTEFWGYVTANAFYMPGDKKQHVLAVITDITEYKKATQEFLRSKSKFETALASISDPFYISDAKGNFIEFNDAFSKFHKAKSKEETRKSLGEYIEILDVYMANGELARPDQWPVPKALRGEVGAGIEYTLRWKDTGETRVVSYSFAPIRDENGEVTGSVVTGHDITDRKQREVQLREANKRLELAQSAAGAGVWDWDTTTGTLTWTNEFFELFGFDPATTEASFENWRGRVHPNDLECVEARIQEALRDHVPLTNQYRIVLPSGEHRWISAYGDTIYDAQGQPLRMTGICIDVTEHQRAARLLASITNTSPDAIFAKDAGGRYLLFNPAAERMTGKKAVEAIGHDDREIFPREIAEFLQESDKNVMRMGYSEKHEESLPGPNGPLNVEVTKSPLYDENGNVVGIFGVTRDISERKRAEEALKQLNTTLEQRVQDEVARNREKDFQLFQQQRLATLGEMLHNISHHWRQPINALGLILQNLEFDYNDGVLDKTGLHDQVQRGYAIAQHLSATIDDFRSFFHPDEEEREFKLSEVLKGTMHIMKESLDCSGIEIVLDVAEDCTIKGYPHELGHVFVNVLKNAEEAIKAREQPGQITIRLESQERMGVVRIQNSGAPIPDEILPRIFEPYFSTKEGGAGIGLYMCRMSLQHLHGHIEACNVNDGATFVISIPTHHQQ